MAVIVDFDMGVVLVDKVLAVVVVVVAIEIAAGFVAVDWVELLDLLVLDLAAL